jgi:hypothetical protein
MNVGSLGIVAGTAGAGLAQRVGSDVDRAEQDAAAQKLLADAAQWAENAAGVGQTNEDQETEERDADGRRPWEIAGQPRKPPPEESPPPEIDRRPAPDPTGRRGSQLDVVG